MEKAIGRIKIGTKDRFDLWVIPRLLLFMVIPGLIVTPLRILVEKYIEGKQGAPDFLTAGFIIYCACAELVFAMGYLIFGYRLPIKNTFLRAFSYIMLILVSSYLPNILAIAGGDGEVIDAAFSVGILIEDVVSYLVKGFVLGLVMRDYDVKNTEPVMQKSNLRFALSCVINGLEFAALNLLADHAAGACDSSWRLCGIMKVSAERETVFYIVFTAFMFAAGTLLPLWSRYCLPADDTKLGTVLNAVKLAAVIWLPNVLIMAFFGTPVLLTAAYGAAYLLIFAVCTFCLREDLWAHAARINTGASKLL